MSAIFASSLHMQTIPVLSWASEIIRLALQRVKPHPRVVEAMKVDLGLKDEDEVEPYVQSDVDSCVDPEFNVIAPEFIDMIKTGGKPLTSFAAALIAFYYGKRLLLVTKNANNNSAIVYELFRFVDGDQCVAVYLKPGHFEPLIPTPAFEEVASRVGLTVPWEKFAVAKQRLASKNNSRGNTSLGFASARIPVSNSTTNTYCNIDLNRAAFALKYLDDRVGELMSTVVEEVRHEMSPSWSDARSTCNLLIKTHIADAETLSVQVSKYVKIINHLEAIQNLRMSTPQ